MQIAFIAIEDVPSLGRRVTKTCKCPDLMRVGAASIPENLNEGKP